MNYSKSPSGPIKGSPYGKQLPEGPIHNFATVIEKTIPEDWQKRTQALSSLVAMIPTGSEYIAADAWYNSPPTLRHLAWPIAELLKDLRSSVVIRTCESCTELFAKCQLDARYLLKDLMPTILALHAQTVAIIRTTVQDMVVDAMAVVPCKMAMPIWLDRLKSDKSRTVREACALYLGVALNEWTDEGYLSVQIWEQVGAALTKALRDPAPTVRQNAKRGLEIVNRIQPDIFDRLVADSDLVRDVRIRKLLGRIQDGEAVADDVSVASSRAGSVSSRRHVSVSGGSVSGGNRGTTPRGSSSSSIARAPSRPQPTNTRNKIEGIPKTIGVTTKSIPTSTETRKGGGGLGPPIRVPGPFHAAVTSPPKIQRRIEEGNEAPVAVGGTAEEYASNGVTTTLDDHVPDIQATNTSFDTTETNESDLPVIASADALREYAKAQGHRRSSLLQERFARAHAMSSQMESTIDLDEILNKESEELEEPHGDGMEASVPPKDHAAPPVATVTLPEHTRIAQALVEAHKKHVDIIMETLKVEMDALKEFELTMLEEGPLRPTEDEVLDYFESVGLCLDQRAKAGAILQKRMDKISQGGL